jgi:hypothetical protein
MYSVIGFLVSCPGEYCTSFFFASSSIGWQWRNQQSLVGLFKFWARLLLVQSVATFFSQVMAAVGGNTAGPGAVTIPESCKQSLT